MQQCSKDVVVPDVVVPDVVVPDAVFPVAWTFRSGYRQGRSPAQRYGFPLKDDDGATSFQTWKYGYRISFTGRLPSFNGATSFQTWKFRFNEAVRLSMISGFNGATSFQTWK